MIINIVCGSPFNINILKKHPSDLTIGVDYGAYRLWENNLPIDAIFGDFDSISQNQFQKLEKIGVKVYKYNAEKDKTDTEIALNYALSLKPQVINLFGVTGKRIDHFLNVLNLFNLVIDFDVDLYIYDEYNKIYLKKPGEYEIFKTDFKYISFFSYGEYVKNLSLINFKYNLTNYFLDKRETLCISNEIISNKGIINFDNGLLLIVESKD